MNTINQNLPLFKNIDQHIIEGSSNYDNIKSKNKIPLSRIDIQKSKNNLIKYFNFLEICKTSVKNEITSQTQKASRKKLKENNNNNKINNSIESINNMKCIDVNEIDTEDSDKKFSVESLGDREYELCLKNALKEALDENEKVR